MNEIYNLNLSENTIKSMIELNPEIINISDEEIKEKKIILEKINCSELEIRNIISSNPLFLNRTNEEIIELLNKLNALGFTTLNILLDSNPYILNLEIFEIEDYINEKLTKGETLEGIINDLESNPWEFNEF